MSHHRSNPSATLADDASPATLEARARRRANARMGWYVHLMVYVVVNAGLMVLAWSEGRHWALYPAMGWGLGLLLHGLGVWLALGGGGLHQRLLDQERARLASQRDPW